jgi:hypothetical protein
MDTPVKEEVKAEEIEVEADINGEFSARHCLMCPFV